MSNLFLKPAVRENGAPVLVRDPETQIPLPIGGDWKSSSPYWVRRLRDGDVVDASAEVTAPAEPAVKSRISDDV